MRLLLCAIIFCTISFNSFANPLKEYRWDNRLVIYSISEADSKQYDMQQIVSINKDKIIDRDMLFFDIRQRNKGNLFVTLSSDDIKELVELYNIDPNESVFILIGKDGGEKERLVSKFDLQYFFDKIDQMPMRIDEMNGL